MEAPLIEENVVVARQNRAPKFRQHSQAITRGSRYQKAAALVDLAEDGVGLPEEVLDHGNFETVAYLYFLYNKLNLVWTLNYIALIVLNFLETPLWCRKETTYTCNDRDYYYLGQLPYFSRSQSLIYEVVTFVVVFVHILFPIAYEGFGIFLKRKLNVLKVVCLVVIFADIITYAIFGSLPFRISSYIRVLLFVLNFRQLRDCVVVIIGMLPTYLNILALLLLFLLFFSWVAYVIFEDTNQAKLVFTSFGETLFQMFVLFTTSNNPDIWIPAYKTSRWTILFFVLYILVGVYFVTNLILAVVYDSFKIQLVKQVSAMDNMRKMVLKKSFNLIDENNVGFLNKDQCILLFEELNNYRTLPNISREEFGLIFDSLDDTRDFQINLEEYYDLCNAIALKFAKGDVPSYLEKFPLIYNSRISEDLKRFVKGRVFVHIITAFLLLNLVAVVVETTLDLANSSSQKVWQLIEFIFGWVYVVEMLLNIYSYGFRNYWRDGGNRFDFAITLVIVVGETMTLTSFGVISFLSNGEWIRYLLLCRILRLIRLLMHVQNYRASISTFLTLIPTLMPYLAVIFCVLCLYSALGVQLFGGIINAGSSVLEKTDIFASDYMDLNFNDFPSAMVTLFTLLVMNNWQVWITSYAELTGTYWTSAFFISFYLISVLLLLNLVVAFVLEAFFAEMEIETPDSNDTLRVRSTKTHSQRVDMLLHHMLKDELGEN